jgi:uncharacterized protein (DUF1684 family)
MTILSHALKSGIIVLSLTFSFALFAQDAQREILDHRKEQEAEFKNKSKSPLLSKDRRKFKHLNYYPIELKYRVGAQFVKTETPELFKMKTTTERLPDYRKYGEVHFEIDGESFTLEVYQSPDIMKRPGYEDYLFIPFTDLTNGHETYEVGRYLEFRIPKTDSVVLDFNQCYNPYCSYSPKFSCPIPPAANNLNIAIPAGEKKYH